MKSISRPGETISYFGFESRPGGKGANQAVAIAKAGGNVDFIGIVGPNGKWLIDELRGHGVGVDRMVVVEVRTSCPIMRMILFEVQVECYDWESIDSSSRRWGELDRYGDLTLEPTRS